MPILALQPWSHFAPVAEEPATQGELPEARGQFVFRGGTAVPMILRAPGGANMFELEQALALNGITHPCGAVLAASHVVQTGTGQTGHIIKLNDVPAGLCLRDPSKLRDGELITAEPGSTTAPLDPLPHDGILCFAAGTQVATPGGARRVETLRPGEIVSTEDKGDQALVWTGRREVLFARGDNRFRPIIFQPGSLGYGTPVRDLIVSPDHHMVLRGPDVAELTGSIAAFVRAGALIDMRGVRQMLGKRRITYIHLMLESHAILRAEEAETESFYPTPMALAALADAQRASVFGHIPALRIAPETAYGPTALPLLSSRDTRALAAARRAAQYDVTSSLAAE
ncbi:MAG: Hint domain-containing protein [Pseudomonadota bacterium]